MQCTWNKRPNAAVCENSLLWRSVQVCDSCVIHSKARRPRGALKQYLIESSALNIEIGNELIHFHLTVHCDIGQKDVESLGRCQSTCSRTAIKCNVCEFYRPTIRVGLDISGDRQAAILHRRVP